MSNEILSYFEHIYGYVIDWGYKKSPAVDLEFDGYKKTLSDISFDFNGYLYLPNGKAKEIIGIAYNNENGFLYAITHSRRKYKNDFGEVYERNFYDYIILDESNKDILFEETILSIKDNSYI